MAACDFSEDVTKRDARTKFLNTYTDLTGQTFLPPDRSYLSLCGYQRLGMGEVAQLLQGFASLGQIVGVDRDFDVIKNNLEQYPEAKWIRGTWRSAMKEITKLNYPKPAVIYLDSTYYALNSKLFSMIAN